MEFFNIIDGQRRDSDKHHRCPDPRTEELLWDAPIATSKDLEDAVAAAQRALKTWSQTSIEERSDYLRKMVAVYTAHKGELMEIVMKETGKSVDLSAVHFEAYDQGADRGAEPHGRNRDWKHVRPDHVL